MTKSLTSHWRRFIHPMSWCCKWIELQMKQLQSQERKYEKELAAYNHSKQLDLEHFTLEDSNIKSIPISDRMHRNKVMKRNKRKRVEEQCDIESYMSSHSLFSYYEKTDCTVDTCLKDVCDVGIGGVNGSNKEFKLNDEWSSGEYGNVDKSLDDIIQKIEAIQSQVQQLKTRTDKTKDEVLIQNQAAKEEWHDFIVYDGTKDSIGEDKFSSDVQVSEPDPHENAMHNEHSTWMSCLH